MESFYLDFKEALDDFSKSLICFAWYNNKLYVKPTNVTECGHRFCELCIREELGIRCVCPYCKQPARIKNLRNSPLHANLVNWTKAMMKSLNNISSTNELTEFLGVDRHISSGSMDDKYTPILENFSTILPQVHLSESRIKPSAEASSFDNENIYFENSNFIPTHLVQPNPKNETKYNRPSSKYLLSRARYRASKNDENDNKLFQELNIYQENNSNLVSKQKKNKKDFTSTGQRKNCELYSLKRLVSTCVIPIGSIASCFDCTARITSDGCLLDEIDLQKYHDPSDWATYLGRTVKNSKLPRQNGWKMVKIGGKPLEEFFLSISSISNISYDDTNNNYCTEPDRRPVVILSNDTPVNTYRPLWSKVLISASGLSLDQINFLKLHRNTTLQYSLDLSKDSDLSTATHLIIDTDSEKKCRRTLKYLFACIQRIPVVSFQWILDSVDNFQWQPISEYIVNQDIQGRTFLSTSREHLFSELTFYYVDSSKLEQSLMPMPSIKKLILAGKGSLFQSNQKNTIYLNRIPGNFIFENISSDILIVVFATDPTFVSSRIKLPSLSTIESNFKGYTIRSVSWVLDCISTDSINSIDRFSILQHI